MSSPTNLDVHYSNGTVDVPHLGITLRRIFGAAANCHNIERDGREVKLTVEGVYVGTLQLKDAQLKGRPNGRAQGVRKDSRGR